MNNTVAHQKLVDDVMSAVGSLPYARCWPQTVGLFRSFIGNRKVKVGLGGMADVSGILLIDREWEHYGSTQYESHGIRLEIECKTGGGKLSPSQKKWRDMIEKFGGIYIQARNVEQVLEELKKYR